MTNPCICKICGFENHKFLTYSNYCDICGSECTHEGAVFSDEFVAGYEGGIEAYYMLHCRIATCPVCLMIAYTDEGYHTWQNGVCTVCQYECAHENFNGYCPCLECALCGIPPTRDHNWDAEWGFCYDCGMGCQHNYNGCKCTVCGYVGTEGHIMENGKCTICDHTHTYENGYCECGAQCPHTSKSSEPEIETEYGLVDGFCYSTRLRCNDCDTLVIDTEQIYDHTFANGECTRCGYPEGGW